MANNQLLPNPYRPCSKPGCGHSRMHHANYPDEAGEGCKSCDCPGFFPVWLQEQPETALDLTKWAIILVSTMSGSGQKEIKARFITKTEAQEYAKTRFGSLRKMRSSLHEIERIA